MLRLALHLLLAAHAAFAQNMFVFNVSCSASAATCSNMVATLNSAGTRLSSILSIQVPINVSVSLQSFGTGLAQALGYAGPASISYGRIDQSRPFTGFPQALLKQIDHSTVYTGYDIVASFNSDFNFYYKSSGTAITSNQYDFEYVACHELTHGLGFIDDLITSFGSSSSAPSFLIPNILVDNSGTTFEGWALPDTFNSFMWDYVKQTNIYSYYQTVTTNYSPINAPLSSLDTAFPQTGVPFTAAQATLNASLSTLLKFNSAFNTTPVALYSPTVFSKGSSIAHVDYNTYSVSADFLMPFSVGNWGGVALDTILAQFNYRNGSVYGPATFAIMASIGWVTEINPSTVVQFFPFNATLAGSGSVPAFCWPAANCTATSTAIAPTTTSSSVAPVVSSSVSTTTASSILTTSASTTTAPIPSTTSTTAATISTFFTTSSSTVASASSNLTMVVSSIATSVYIANTTTSGQSTDQTSLVSFAISISTASSAIGSSSVNLSSTTGASTATNKNVSGVSSIGTYAISLSLLLVAMHCIT